jgi:hypothetical protein
MQQGQSLAPQRDYQMTTRRMTGGLLYPTTTGTGPFALRTISLLLLDLFFTVFLTFLTTHLSFCPSRLFPLSGLAASANLSKITAPPSRIDIPSKYE